MPERIGAPLRTKESAELDAVRVDAVNRALILNQNNQRDGRGAARNRRAFTVLTKLDLNQVWKSSWLTIEPSRRKKILSEQTI
jgi:hypothetical protein